MDFFLPGFNPSPVLILALLDYRNRSGLKRRTGSGAIIWRVVFPSEKSAGFHSNLVLHTGSQSWDLAAYVSH